MLEICFDGYYGLPDAERNKMNPKYYSNYLFLKTYNYIDWFKNKESTDATRKSDQEEYVDLSDMLPLNVMKKWKEEKD